MARVPIANLKGPEGKQGPQGLPGAEGVPTDEAVSILLGIPSESQTALREQMRTWQERLQFNILDFGAVNDAAVDSSAAIQAALDAASGVGEVILPPGDYGIASRVEIPAQTVMRGYGATVHRLPGLGGMFTNWSDGDVTTTGYNGWSDITIEGVTFDAHGDTNTINLNMVTFGHARNIRVRDCRFLRCRGFHPVEVNAVEFAWIENNRFEGFIADPTLLNREAVQIDAATPGDYGVADDTPARDIIVRGNVFTGFEALPAQAVAVGSHTRPGTTGYYDRIIIRDNIIKGTTSRGIAAEWFRDSKIEGNTIEATGSNGVRLVGCIRTDVSNVTVIGPVTHGISMTASGSFVCENCSVSGCTVEGATEGIVMISAARPMVVNNTVRRTSSYGVTANATTDALIQGNLIDGAGFPGGAWAAIRLSPSSGVPVRTSIVGNRTLLHNGATQVDAGVSNGTGAVDTWVFGNDFKGLVNATTGDPVNSTGNRT